MPLSIFPEKERTVCRLFPDLEFVGTGFPVDFPKPEAGDGIRRDPDRAEDFSPPAGPIADDLAAHTLEGTQVLHSKKFHSYIPSICKSPNLSIRTFALCSGALAFGLPWPAGLHDEYRLPYRPIKKLSLLSSVLHGARPLTAFLLRRYAIRVRCFYRSGNRIPKSHHSDRNK